MTDLIIRSAVSSDAASLAALQERTFRATFGADNNADDMDQHCRNHYGTAIQSAEICDPTLTTLVCDDMGTLVGFVQLRQAAVPNQPVQYSAMEIQRIYLDAAWHGRGLAQRLMENALEHARKHGALRLWLGVWERNPRAIGFYKKFGFAECGEHIFMVGSDPQRDLILQREISY